MSANHQLVEAERPTIAVPDAAAAPPAGSGPTQTETSLISRFVALLAPLFAMLAGAIAGYVAKHIPGVALDPAQIVAFMIAASTAALSSAWKWLQGWQQHELLVAEGRTLPRKPGPLVAAGRLP